MHALCVLTWNRNQSCSCPWPSLQEFCKDKKIRENILKVFIDLMLRSHLKNNFASVLLTLTVQLSLSNCFCCRDCQISVFFLEWFFFPHLLHFAMLHSYFKFLSLKETIFKRNWKYSDKSGGGFLYIIQCSFIHWSCPYFSLVLQPFFSPEISN